MLSLRYQLNKITSTRQTIQKYSSSPRTLFLPLFGLVCQRSYPFVWLYPDGSFRFSPDFLWHFLRSGRWRLLLWSVLSRPIQVMVSALSLSLSPGSLKGWGHCWGSTISSIYAVALLAISLLLCSASLACGNLERAFSASARQREIYISRVFS
jgi:hypothetical protein